MVLALAGLLAWPMVHAQEQPWKGALVQVPSREGTLPVYEVWKPDARATLVLYSGGAGGFGRVGDDGWPTSGNFLIRSARWWAAYPVNLVLVGRPQDIPELDGPARIGDKHAQDNLALLRHIRAQSAAPIWLLGTSMGSISAVAATIQDREQLVAGLVLTSSVTASRTPGAVLGQDLARIRVPVLVVSHRDDACNASRPSDGARIVDSLSQAPVKKLLMLEGGAGARGNPCEAFHWHGFIGMEQQAVDAMAAWIQHPVN
jgi:hypothetical protein